MCLFWYRVRVPAPNCGVGVLGCVCVCARPVPVSCQSQLGSALCKFRYALCLHRVNTGCGLWFVCLGTVFAFTAHIKAGVRGCVYLSVRSACPLPIVAVVCVRVFRCGFLLYSAEPGLGSCCVCLGSDFAFTPPILAEVCVSEYAYCFHPANPPWGVGACVFVCALCLHSAYAGWN